MARLINKTEKNVPSLQEEQLGKERNISKQLKKRRHFGVPMNTLEPLANKKQPQNVSTMVLDKHLKGKGMEQLG